MILVVGLGNPGPQYARTRHNSGFMFVDHFRSSYFPDAHWRKNQKLSSLVCRPTPQLSPISSSQFPVVLAQPQTFMNSSGLAVKRLLKFYKISLSRSPAPRSMIHDPCLIVAHDDLDIRLGDFKLQFATGPKDHKGMQSIYQHLKINQFWHLRLGVDHRSPDNRVPGETYVLQNFPREELDIFRSVLDQASATLLNHLSNH
jgi:PTH1 family peptidyl-tRNA hydrolase